ncbi:MAG: aldo/keto reductase [Methanomicrobiaceae archaeon]|nr:aldo/keto reductase [Methanomicrobiaceae archaeon]
MNQNMPYRELGTTGEKVSIIGIGGFHLGIPQDPAEAVSLVREAIDSGINFLDNSWDYHRGESERRMGEALKGGYRERAFVMTKVDGRTKEAARAQLEESLHRLGVDCIDLVQLHEVIRFSDVKRAFAPGGAIEAMVEARDEGLVRFIGFTGHKDPDIQLRMLDHEFAWDAVQIPLNVLDAHFRSFEKGVLPGLVERKIGVIGMKPFSAGMLFDTGTVTAIEALHYVMNLPVDVVVTGMESRADLAQALEAAASFRPLDDEEVESILARTATKAENGAFELYKTTRNLDSTSMHPEWLESAKMMR